MITRIVKVKIKKENLKEFRNYISEFLNEVKSYANNYYADSFADLEDELNFHIYTIWNTEDGLNEFRKSDINLNFKNNITEWSSEHYSAWTVENI